MKKLLIYILPLFLLFGHMANTQNLTGVKIHINPGHGGWDSNDRGIPTPLFPSVGPNVGFWESQSNLDKGLMLKPMLEELGATVQISRTQNRTEDDLALSQIVRMANEFKADFMLSIHSNAGSGTANSVLMLYAGVDTNDPQQKYPTATPKSTESRDISTEIAKNLIKNEITHWTSAAYRVTGDKTFGRTAMGWSDGYGVLRGLTVPGVISEGSMHDYIPETYRLLNMEYKWLEAWNFKKAFCTYFKNAEIPTGNIAGWVKDSRLLILDGTYRKHGKDVLLPIEGAVVTIVGTDKTYTTDNRRNGVYAFKDLAPGTYTVKVEAEGYHSREQEVVVVQDEISYFNFELNRERNTPPEVIDYSPKVGPEELVITSTDIILQFNWDMDEVSTAAAFSITPSVAGDLTFEDSQYRLRFKPHYPLEKSTLYTVKLDKSAMHPGDVEMVEDFSFTFTTADRNRLVLIGGYPDDGNERVYAEKPQIWLVFDKKLDTSSTRDEINVYDISGKAFDKPTRSVKQNKFGDPYGDFFFELSEPLVPGNEYYVRVGSELKDVDGVKFVDPYEVHFKAADIKVTDKEVIEPFEDANLFTLDDVQSEHVSKSSIARNTSTKLFEKSSYKIAVEFSQLHGEAVFTTAEPIVSFDTKKAFGLHVFGDMSGNELQLVFEAGTETKYLTLCDLTFVGWEYVEAEFETEDFHQLVGFRIIGKDGMLPRKTEIFVDNLLMYDEVIFGLEELPTAKGIQIYPNPASDVINVNTANEDLTVIEFYALNGMLLKIAVGNQIDIHEFNQGTYILKVKTPDVVVSRPIIVVK